MVSPVRNRSHRTRSAAAVGAAAATSAIILTTALQALAAPPVPVAHKVPATAGRIGDFSTGEMKSKVGGWAAFHFAQSGEQPTATCTVVTDDATKKKALRFEGKIADGAQFAFAGTGWAYTGGAAAPCPVDLSAFKGIRFRVRGDENPYRLSILTASVQDHNYHGRTFVAEKEWTTVDVPFTELKQTEGWGTPVVFSPKDVSFVSFGTMYQATGAAWFELADVELYK
jgi:hypothetical protein